MTEVQKDKYFASLPTDEIAGELHARVKTYYDTIWRTGRLDLWRTSRTQYNISRRTGGIVQEFGQQGEYLKLAMNHYASIIQNQLAMITAQKIAWDPKAVNTDFRSQTQAVLAKGLLDYYVHEKRLGSSLSTAIEHCMVYSEAGVLVEWDPLVGDPVESQSPPMAPLPEVAEPEIVPELDGLENLEGLEFENSEEVDSEEVNSEELSTIHYPLHSQPQRAGDIECGVYSPIDIIRDPVSRLPLRDHPWLIVRKWVNKFELAAQYPEYKDEIEAMSWTKDIGNHDFIDTAYAFLDSDANTICDDIPLFVFYHRISPILKDGRMVEFLNEEIVLTDSALPYKEIPLKWVAFRIEDETAFGYSAMWDLLQPQEAISALHSTIATNHKHFGLNILMVPRGQGWDISKAASGLSVIEVDAQLPQSAAPQSIDLLGNNAEAMNYISMLVKEMETISGVNSVSRGNPEASLRSGAALALVQSMAVQFAHQLQQSYYQLLEDVGTAVIERLKDFATVPRVAEISGKSKRGVLMEFSSEDLKFVNRVVVEPGNPMSKTLSGRANMVDLLIQQGSLKSPQSLLQVIETGSLEATLEGDTAGLLLIKAENESLENGDYPVQAIVTDQHLDHILGHSPVLSSPSARQDVALVQRVTAHLLEHLGILMDPNNAVLLAALGQQSMGMPPAQAPPAGNGAGVAAGVDPAAGEAQQPNMPNMPNNAMTGERFVPATDGSPQ